MASPFDLLFRFTFGQDEHAASLLRALLPEALAERLRSPDLRAVPAAKAGPELRLHHADLLFAADLPGAAAPVVFLFEHKSAPDPGLLRQLHRYVLHVGNEWLHLHGVLPFVVPVVLHHGPRRLGPAAWGPRPTNGIGAVQDVLARFDPSLHFLVDDLSQRSEAELHAQPLTALARLTRLCLQCVPRRSDDAALAALTRWADLLRAVESGPGGQFALEALCSYFLYVTDLAPETLATVVTDILRKPTGSTVMSTADRLIAKGRAEGKAEGKAEGNAEGRASIVLRLLVARFGPLSPDVEARVRSAGPDDLDRLALRVLDAQSLAEVLDSL